MEEIYSKISSKLLHVIMRSVDIQDERTNISSDSEYLQAASLSLSMGKSFRPHVHIWNPREVSLTQETWIITKGKVRITYFDTNDTELCQRVLFAGDLSITFWGGHKYEVLEDSLVYEIKNGPYLGQSKDKRFIPE
jgi:hypothetical protein